MRQIIFHIPDSDHSDFLKATGKLTYAEKVSDEHLEQVSEVPEWQKEIVRQRMAGPQEFTDLDEFMKELDQA